MRVFKAPNHFLKYISYYSFTTFQPLCSSFSSPTLYTLHAFYTIYYLPYSLSSPLPKWKHILSWNTFLCSGNYILSFCPCLNGCFFPFPLAGSTSFAWPLHAIMPSLDLRPFLHTQFLSIMACWSICWKIPFMDWVVSPTKSFHFMKNIMLINWTNFLKDAPYLSLYKK